MKVGDGGGLAEYSLGSVAGRIGFGVEPSWLRGITLPNYFAGHGISELQRFLERRCGAQLLVGEGGCRGLNYGD